MQRVTVQLPTLAENLALDEALLDQTAALGDQFRLWEVATPAVVLGRASRIHEEVEETYCREHQIPIVRRCSGGAAVVVMSGCLLYSVTLRLEDHPELRIIERAHAFVLERIAAALRRLDLPVTLDGTSDLTWNGRKFSGNSLRCKQDAILYHGTLLVTASIDLIGRCLKMPPRQPDYRQRRSHADFLTNIPVAIEPLKLALAEVWNVITETKIWPEAAVQRLLQDRYLQAHWNSART